MLVRMTLTACMIILRKQEWEGFHVRVRLPLANDQTNNSSQTPAEYLKMLSEIAFTGRHLKPS